MAGSPSNKPTWHHRGLLIPGGEDRSPLPNPLLCTSKAFQNEIMPNPNFSLIWVNLMEISGCCSKSKWALIISPNFTSFSISQHCCCLWTGKPDTQAWVFLCPLHPLQCFEILIFGELVCVVRKKRRECEMVHIRSCRSYQTLCAGLGQCRQPTLELPYDLTESFLGLAGHLWSDLRNISRETSWIHAENAFVRQSSLNSLCLGEHHLVNKNIVWESALCKTLCNNPFCDNRNL